MTESASDPVFHVCQQEGPQKMCKCGRGPYRKGQRNCRLCNNEASAKYYRSLQRAAGKFKKIKAVVSQNSKTNS